MTSTLHLFLVIKNNSIKGFWSVPYTSTSGVKLYLIFEACAFYWFNFQTIIQLYKMTKVNTISITKNAFNLVKFSLILLRKIYVNIVYLVTIHCSLHLYYCLIADSVAMSLRLIYSHSFFPYSQNVHLHTCRGLCRSMA